MSSTWRTADVVAARFETPSARTLALQFPEPVTSIGGQHVDIRLTAPDGYTAVRSFSVAGTLPPNGLEITVEELEDGEVSPYLVRDLEVGGNLEMRGPVGGWFVWQPTDTGPVQLIGGGSGVVPLMAIVRSHRAAASTAPMHLLYSVREPSTVYYRGELEKLEAAPQPLPVEYVYTRRAPGGEPVGRLTPATMAPRILPPAADPAVFVCGATAFVEAVAAWLVEAGYSPDRIKTERYGGIGDGT
ncbi:FAD-binding oxidoreductase [Arthrobacter sp. TMN-37]